MRIFQNNNYKRTGKNENLLLEQCTEPFNSESAGFERKDDPCNDNRKN